MKSPFLAAPRNGANAKKSPIFAQAVGIMIIVLRLAMPDDRTGPHQLRRLLKVLLRRYGIRCIGCEVQA